MGGARRRGQYGPRLHFLHKRLRQVFWPPMSLTTIHQTLPRSELRERRVLDSRRCLRILTKFPESCGKVVRRAVLVLGLPGRFGLFGDGFRTFSCESHTEDKIEVGSVPSGPNVGVEGFWERGGCVKLGRLFQRRGPYPIFSGRVHLP